MTNKMTLDEILSMVAVDGSTLPLAKAEIIKLIEERGAEVVKLVDEQREDERLWFIAHPPVEGYLQQALRKLHATIKATYCRNQPPN